jgi:hypothetical protein
MIQLLRREFKDTQYVILKGCEDGMNEYSNAFICFLYLDGSILWTYQELALVWLLQRSGAGWCHPPAFRRR